MANNTESLAPLGPRVVAQLIRGDAKSVAKRIGFTTFLAWAGSCVLFLSLTSGGRAAVQASGMVAVVLSWLLISVILALGYAAGYLVLRHLASGTKPIARSGVPRLALVDSLAAMAGGYAIGFLPLSLSYDPMTMIAWSAVVGALFSFVAVNPGYVQRFDAAVVEGHIVRDLADG